jgi:subtilase family protein
VYKSRHVVRSCVLLLASLAFVSTANAATLGRGLAQLVSLFETQNPNLSSALRIHVTAPDGEVLVHIRIDESADQAATLKRLAAAGFHLTALSELDPTLAEGYLALGAARTAAAVDGVLRVLAVQRPFVLAGKVQSQAVAVEKADLAQARGVTGAGTRVGALSDSYDKCPRCSTHAAGDVATGDLPPGVVVLEEISDPAGSDEGRAMLQLVHDVAPGAKLGFATAFNGEVDFSNNILNLRRLFHADVITDDVIYFDEPMYSDGLLARTVDQVVKEGAAYFSSAGNNGLEAYESTYEAVPLAAAKALVAAGRSNLDLDALAAHGLDVKSLHNFRNADGSPAISQRFRSYFGDVVDFQWDEPFDVGRVRTDYNIIVFDAAGHFIDPNDPNSDAFFTTDDNTQTDQAVELFAVNPGTYQVVIAKMNNGPARRIKYVTVNGTGESERQNAPSVWGHTAARRGQSVAAMYYGITSFPEDFSSPGPVTILFDRKGHRLDEPEVRRVPQLTAADGVDTTFFGFDIEPNGFPNFFGTSAAAPDAAAVAALVIEAAGGPGTIEPEEVYERLQRTATAMPLSANRTLAAAFSGPVVAVANGDFPRETNYWQLGIEPFAAQTVNSVTINLTNADMLFSNPTSPTTGFRIGTTKGLSPGDVTVARSADRTSLILTFKPGTFGAGDFLTFANFAFPSQLPVQFEVDADRVQNGVVTVALSDGTTRAGTFRVERLQRINSFTGAGLVNADAATRARGKGRDDGRN